MRIILKLLAAPFVLALTLLVAVLNFAFSFASWVFCPVLSLSDRSPVCFIHGGSLGHTGACDRLCCFALRPARCGGVAH